MTHADNHNILYPLQHCFRKNRSCETQLLEFIDDVTKNMENSLQADVLIRLGPRTEPCGTPDITGM
jgi:hypothetical protein